MNFLRALFAFSLLLFQNSCITIRDLRYAQPNENLQVNQEGLIPYRIPEYRVTQHDILKLDIITTPKGDAAQFFSAQYGASGATTTGTNARVGGSFYFTGLKLNTDGSIDPFGMGRIHAEGRTLKEIEADIQKEINEKFLPGKAEAKLNLEGIKYYILSDIGGKSAQVIEQVPTLNWYEALAKNGGLDRTIDRKNLELFRKYPDGYKRIRLDLTREDVMNSPYFWVQNGDMLLLNTRPKNIYGFGQDPIQSVIAGVSVVTTALSVFLLIRNFTK